MSDAPPPAEVLIAALGPDYGLGASVRGELIQDGLNTHYLIQTPEARFVLRLYRPGWRTADDIAYELAALEHLAARGVAVCAPLARRDGARQGSVETTEGPRVAVLFEHAPGEPPVLTEPGALHACGRAMALIHQHTDDFACLHERFRLDLTHILDEPLAVLRRLLAHRPEDAASVERLVEGLHVGLEERIAGLEWGFCHADFHNGNTRLDAAGTLRVFDFDCGGPGWRAYDLTVCRLFCQISPLWEGFCAAYEDVRPIPEATRAALPWFLVARQVWRMALFAERWPRLTGRPADDRFIDDELGALRQRLTWCLPGMVGLG